MHFSKLAALATCAGLSHAWLPHEVANKKLHARDITPDTRLRARDGSELFKRQAGSLNKGIRGVNLGSLFLFEPWIAQNEWQRIGCGNAGSEFDCGRALGQDGVNKAFQDHWGSWYSQDDFQQMKSAGLNTVRIPLGYWMYEDIVDSSTEPFPQGGFDYLQKVCGWASDAGLYIILDLHGAPGAQVSSNADTGQLNPSPGFYSDENYERGLKFLEWITGKIHSTNELRNVGMLEVLNEPETHNAQTDTMRTDFYPNAQKRIRAAESTAGVSSEKSLHIMYMNTMWGAGDPSEHLSDTNNVAYDDHRYLQWADNQDQTQDAFLKTSCHDDRSQGQTPTIVGEFSLSSTQKDGEWDPSTNADWYNKWFQAQAKSYESSAYGWIFWTWKGDLDDPRWSFKDAQSKGLIPKSLDDISSTTACNGY